MQFRQRPSAMGIWSAVALALIGYAASIALGVWGLDWRSQRDVDASLGEAVAAHASLIRLAGEKLTAGQVDAATEMLQRARNAAERLAPLTTERPHLAAQLDAARNRELALREAIAQHWVKQWQLAVERMTGAERILAEDLAPADEHQIATAKATLARSAAAWQQIILVPWRHKAELDPSGRVRISPLDQPAETLLNLTVDQMAALGAAHPEAVAMLQ